MIMAKRKTPKGTFTYDEVQTMIQTIYSEFAELPTEQKTRYSLQLIIEQEIEQHPTKPIWIFNK